MRGFLQCMIIDTHGGTYNNTLKAIPLEEPPQDSSKEAAPVALYEREDIRDIKSFLKKDINKELAFSLCDAQRSKQYYLECIEVLFKECTKSGGTYVCKYMMCNIKIITIYICVRACVRACVCM